MTRHVIIHGKNPAGKRTGASVHFVLFELFSLSIGSNEEARMEIRSMIQSGSDSHEIAAELMLKIAKPSLVKQLGNTAEIQMDIED